MLFWNSIIFSVVVFIDLVFGIDLGSQCVSKLHTAWNTAIRILFNVPRDTHRYLIERISIANDCSVNPSDLSKMLVKKQMKYFDVKW